MDAPLQFLAKCGVTHRIASRYIIIRLVYTAVALSENKEGTRMASLANILWLVVVVLVVLWLLGFLLNVGGGIIHLLLVIAVIVVAYNLLTGRRTL